MITVLVAMVAAFLAAVLLTRRFCDPDSSLHLLDHPNERSLHTRPTPRTGGVALLAGLFLGVMVVTFGATFPAPIYGLAAGLILVAGLSFLDDRRGLPPSVRLVGHLMASALPVLGGMSLATLSLPGFEWHWPTWLGGLFSLLFLVWMINLYNFMDGMDGFAGGMAVIGFGTCALLGWQAGHVSFVAMNLQIVAAAAGFLVFNFPPARIFMGDTGSSSLGLLAGGVALWGVRDDVFPFWVAILVFSPFIVDATVTLVRRLFRGERVWQAHRTHYYQRLVQLGWGHRRTVMAEYALMLGCGLTALAVRQVGTMVQAALLVFWCLAYLALMAAIARMEKKKARS